MAILRTFLPLILLLLGTGASGQSPVQVRYVFPVEEDVLSNAAGPLSDGGAVIGLHPEDQLHFGMMRVGMDGMVLWARKWMVDSTLTVLHHALGEWGNGDLFLLGTTWSPPHTDLILSRLTSAGDLVSSMRYDLGPAYFDYERLGAAHAPDGGLVIWATRETYVDLLKVDVTGQLSWTMRLNTSADGVSYCNVMDMTFASNGDLVLAGWSLDLLWITRIGLDGSIVWSHGCSLLGGFAACIAPSNDGGFIIGGAEGLGHGLALKIDGSGDVVWARTYDPSPNPSLYFTDVAVDPDGEMVFSSMVGPWAMVPGTYNLIHCDADGGLVDTWRMADYDTEPLSSSFLQYADGWFTGWLSFEDLFGSPYWTNMVWWRMPVEQPATCHVTPFLVTANDLSGLDMTTNVVVTADTVSSVLMDLVASEVDVQAVDLCTGLPLHVTEASAFHLPDLLVIGAGDVIQIPQRSAALVLEVFDLTGRLAARSSPGGAIRTDGWASGHYTVVGMDRLTGQRHIVRLMIQ